MEFAYAVVNVSLVLGGNNLMQRRFTDSVNITTVVIELPDQHYSSSVLG